MASWKGFHYQKAKYQKLNDKSYKLHSRKSSKKVCFLIQMLGRVTVWRLYSLETPPSWWIFYFFLLLTAMLFVVVLCSQNDLAYSCGEPVSKIAQKNNSQSNGMVKLFQTFTRTHRIRANVLKNTFSLQLGCIVEAGVKIDVAKVIIVPKAFPVRCLIICEDKN